MSEDELTFEEELIALASDAVAEQDFDPFRAELFRLPAGSWARARDLCRLVPALRQRIVAAEKRALTEGYPLTARLSVRWQPYPESPDYCTITFFLDVNMWNWMQVYNLSQFKKKYDPNR